MKQLDIGLLLGIGLLWLLVGLVFPALTWAQQGLLENPQNGSFQSGIGTISGWVCNANRVDIVFDGTITMQAAYGTSRQDTQAACGKANTGIGLLVNWNLLGDGTHTVSARADGVQFASATFTVKTLGHEFLQGFSGQGKIINFDNQINVKVQWQENCQCFVIVDATAPIRLGPPTGTDYGPAFPLCEAPDAGRAAKAAAIAAFAQQTGYLHHNVQLCAVSTDNPLPYVQGQPIQNNAFSVPPSGPIFYDVTLLNDMNGIDDFGDTFVLAHELGHQVQFDTSSRVALLSNLQRELQADCLAGIYFGHLAAIGLFPTGDAGGLAEAICAPALKKGFGC